MLNTTSFYSNLGSSSPYMTPTRTRSRTGLGAPGGGGRCETSASGDYFSVSSADFGYDLFVHGLVSCDSSSSAYNSSAITGAATTAQAGAITSASSTGHGFLSRCRSSRPFYHTSSSNTASASSGLMSQSLISSPPTRHHQQQVGGGLLSTSSITSLNRASYHEQPYNYHTNNDISSQQQRMKGANLLASNLSLGNVGPFYTNFNPATVSGAATANLRQTIAEEVSRKSSPRALPSLFLLPTPTNNKPLATYTNQSTTVDHMESESVENLSHQQRHALHRFRRQKKKGFLSRLRDVVISFTPKARISIVNRHDIFVRFGQEEKDALACFDFLDKLPANNTSDNRDVENDTSADAHDLSLAFDLHEWQTIAESVEPTAALNQTTSCDKSPTKSIALLASSTTTTADATCTASIASEVISNKATTILDADHSANAEEESAPFDYISATSQTPLQVVQHSKLEEEDDDATQLGESKADVPELDSLIVDADLTSSDDKLRDECATNNNKPVSDTTCCTTSEEQTVTGRNQSVEDEDICCLNDNKSDKQQSTPQPQRSNSGSSASGKQSKSKKWRQKSKAKQSKQANGNNKAR